jgi:hypothetical protein
MGGGEARVWLLLGKLGIASWAAAFQCGLLNGKQQQVQLPSFRLETCRAPFYAHQHPSFSLPRCPAPRRRSTLIFVRVQLRVVTPVLIAVVISLLFLTLIPSLRDSCWAAVDAQARRRGRCRHMPAKKPFACKLHASGWKELASPPLPHISQS